MRNINFRHLKGLIVLTTSLLTIIGSTTAYFTSTVNANGNEIIAGSVSLALDTTSTHESVSEPLWNTHAYNVAFDNNGVTEAVNTFESWSGALPGEFFSYYFGIRNLSNTDLKFKFRTTGEWQDLRDSPECVASSSAVTFKNIKLFGEGNDCELNVECKNIKDGLSDLASNWLYRPSTNTTSITQELVNNGSGFNFIYGTNNGLDSGENIVLGPSEFVVYKMDMSLDSSIDDCYQGANYEWGIELRGYQVTAPWTP